MTDTTMERGRRRPTVLVRGLCLLAGAILVASTAHAQDLPLPGDGFAWERVGDVGIDVFDLAFSGDGTLWATASAGPYRLDLSGGFPGTWALLHESGRFSGAVLPLGGDGPSGPGPDTLLAGTAGTTERSTDGGLTWEDVYHEEANALYAVPEGYPHAGRLLVGDLQDIAYSDDRAASFTPSVVPGQGTSTPGGGADFVALPPGASHPGRVLAAGRWGVSISDDGGETFRESGLYEVLRYSGIEIAVVERPDDGIRALMSGFVNLQPHARLWLSDDEGETWYPKDGLHLMEGPPFGESARAMLRLGRASALVVLGGGTVYRTDDAGEVWKAVGRAPEIGFNPTTRVVAAALGPDGRLYVGLHQSGTARGWVWRTAERLSVPTSSDLVPEPEEVLRVEVSPNPSRGPATVTLMLGQPAEVEAALYDVLGRRVALLHEGVLPAGRHAFALDAEDLPPGVYVVRVAADGAVAARTVTRLR